MLRLALLNGHNGHTKIKPGKLSKKMFSPFFSLKEKNPSVGLFSVDLYEFDDSRIFLRCDKLLKMKE